MKILELVIDSEAGKIFTSQLTHESIKDYYTGVNSYGTDDEHICTCKQNKKCMCDKVGIHKIEKGLLIIAAYSSNQVQKWFFETPTPKSLACRLVQQFGLLPND